ncbi:TIGR03936 family radical SAM-associated protein [Acidipropionibacterium timonense]|uniref:TIGR03936 family radical SAM-associated protein n=1 Tax=Acidipropionibacterium timonense TaxID=2161818 RepID=UPI001FDAA7FC|nr:TIGR03936 family radical SAM-associated protein [Acidipropionibacterium timonense]
MTPRNDQPEQQAPPAQRLRLRYAKRSTARFTSHRDFARAFERALNRARIPMAYSSGFNPHPRISYANASPTGAASEAEYLEIALARVCDPAKVASALAAQMPPGMVVLEVVESDRAAWTDVLTASAWVAGLPGRAEEGRVDRGEDDLGVDSAVAALLAARSCEVERMTRSGMRTFDVRGAVIGLGRQGDRLRMMLHHDTPLVRPDDVLSALVARGARLDPRVCPLTRLAQGVVQGEGLDAALVDPFDGRSVVVWPVDEECTPSQV